MKRMKSLKKRKMDKEQFKKLFRKIINIISYASYGFFLIVMIIAFWGGQIAYVTGNIDFKDLLLWLFLSACGAVILTDPILYGEE